jgi:UDP-N-acetyl-D-glucosamine dehydrogenase
MPLVVAFAEAGHQIVGFDQAADRVETLRAGHTHVEDVEDASLAPLLDRIEATNDGAALATCEAIVICVPTCRCQLPPPRSPISAS